MDRDIELALKTLNSEFRTIKNSLEPLSAEFKKLNLLDIELKRLKSEIIPKIKNIELRARESLSMPKENKFVADYKNLEAQINKIKTEFLTLRKKPFIDKEQDSALRSLSENQGLIDVKVRKITREFEEKYKKQIDSNREMVINLVSEKDSMKHELEKNSLEFEKIKKGFDVLRTAFQERDTQLTKDVNTRKRHINQVVEEINDSRKKIYLQGTLIAENQTKIDELKNQIAKNKNDLQNLNKSNSAKVESKDIDDTKIAFSRLDKKTTSDISEIKARMRELERKVVGKKDIDSMQTRIDEIQTKEINILKEEFAKLTAELSGIPNHVETKLSNLKRVMEYLELIKKDIDKVESRTGTVESKLSEVGRIKSEIENIKKNMKNISAPTDDMSNISNYIDIIKHDNETIKKEQNQMDARLKKLSENTADISLLNSIKKEVSTAITKAEKLSSVVDIVEQLNQRLVKMEAKTEEKVRNLESEMERINIKAENTSRILKEMDKVL